MKTKIIFLSMILANMLQAQTANYLDDDFYWVDKDSIIFTKIKFDKNGRFEVMEDNFYDCTSTFSIYGRGEYRIIKDSILFVFDSIPNSKSECKIDSIPNEGDHSNLNIIVLDEHGKKIRNAELHWGKPKRKNRWITAQFFEEQFDEEIELKFTKNEEIYFVRIEKEGYYWAKIPIPKHPNKDYKIKIVLRPRPKANSRNYLSNATGKMAIISDCEIQYYNERKLRRESCH